MAFAEQTSPVASVAQVKQPSWIGAIGVSCWRLRRSSVCCCCRRPRACRVAGHRMLAILVFAVIVWMTEALDYAVSAVVIAALMAFLLGFSPNPANPKALDGHERGPDARVQRLCQYRPRAGRIGAVSCRRHDGDRPRQADRAQHPVARRRRDPQRRDRHDSCRLCDCVSGPVDHGARRLPRSDHARHHCGFRREQEGRLRQHADDHDGSDREHLECRHQDCGGAEHGRHRLHREGIRQDHHVAGMADRRGAVRRPDVDRALFRDDAHDAAGSDASPRRA